MATCSAVVILKWPQTRVGAASSHFQPIKFQFALSPTQHRRLNRWLRAKAGCFFFCQRAANRNNHYPFNYAPICPFLSVVSLEIAQLTSCDSGIAETPETDDSVSAHYWPAPFLPNAQVFSDVNFLTAALFSLKASVRPCGRGENPANWTLKW